jgi:hypothetical protein
MQTEVTLHTRCIIRYSGLILCAGCCGSLFPQACCKLNRRLRQYEPNRVSRGSGKTVRLDPRIRLSCIPQKMETYSFQIGIQTASGGLTNVNVAASDLTGPNGRASVPFRHSPVGLVGYAPSMRPKWIREGTNDFEYVQILKAMRQGTWALQQAMAVGQDWRNWTRDYTQVEAVRVALGN